jgi:hypothetical protein
MIDSYVTHLIDELPDSFIKKYKNTNIHLVLEGGLFNGSYLTGCIFYIKELEKRKYINIQKLSGCSIGSIIALLYFIEDEAIILNIYKLAYNHFKETYNINIFNTIFTIIRKHLPINILNLIQNKLYITYFNVETSKQIVKYKYKDIDELFEIIRRSCSFPYIIDNQIYYKKKYIDGLYPHIFKRKSKNKKGIKILYLNIHHFNKLSGMLSVKNENTNIHRVLEGVIEAHIFFTKDYKTTICSFVDSWNLYDIVLYYIFINIMHSLIFLLNKYYILSNLINKSIINNKIQVNNLVYEIYINFLNNYCI